MLHKQLLLGAAALALLAGCGSDSTAKASQVATLGSTGTSGTTATSTDAASTADTQAALLAYAACMRENGVDMADPTFDADGNPTSGGLFGGQDSGIDPRSDEFQPAQEACGDLIDGISLGGPGQGGGLDVDAVQTSLNEFTSCLRDNGLDVDDIDFAAGRPGGDDGTGGGGFGGPPADGSFPAGATPADGSVPAGGFQGPPPGADGGPGTDGFDPTTRIIEQLGLDDTDPAVTTAIDACQSILDGAFQPTTSTTG